MLHDEQGLGPRPPKNRAAGQGRSRYREKKMKKEIMPWKYW